MIVCYLCGLLCLCFCVPSIFLQDIIPVVVTKMCNILSDRVHNADCPNLLNMIHTFWLSTVYQTWYLSIISDFHDLACLSYIYISLHFEDIALIAFSSVGCDEVYTVTLLAASRCPLYLRAQAQMIILRLKPVYVNSRS